jgi:hypothetical protein
MPLDDVEHLGTNDDRRALAMGEFPIRPPSNIKIKEELAEVMDYTQESNSYVVVTRGAGGEVDQPGGKTLKGVPRKLENPGMASSLPIGTVVVIDYGLGFPYISGVLPIDLTREKVQGINKPKGISDQNSSPTSNPTIPADASAKTGVGFYSQPGAPQDLLPGDQVMFHRDGNRMGSLGGNYNVMDAGGNTKAKVETLGKHNLVRTTCENYEHFSGFGTFSVYNAEGRCGIQYRGAVDQLNESGGDDELWTFKLDVGETGEYFTMEICGSDGGTQAKWNISPNGRVTFLATDGLDLINGSDTPSHEEHGGDVFKRMLGTLYRIVEGGDIESIAGVRDVTVGENDLKVVGNNDTTMVNNSQTINVGGNRRETITGGFPLSAKPSNVAVTQTVLNGSYVLDIGNPKLGASPVAKAGYSLFVHTGDIIIGENPAQPAALATVSLNTLKPDSIALGGTTKTSVYHAALYEQLDTWLSEFLILFDNHTHNYTLPSGVTLVPTIPIGAHLTPKIQLLKSLRVKIGG